MLKVFYNEIDKYAAQWIRNLGSKGHIAEGHVEEMSIEKLTPNQLAGFQRLHFFAGLGGWDYALKLAGWPSNWPVWTGSCPCQPFSAAGKRKGIEDPRHLWPEFLRLISELRPPTIFGEQVASKDGRQWLSGIRADLEALGYAFGAADYCAAGVGAPHIRQRLWWVAYSHERSDNQGIPRFDQRHRKESLQRITSSGLEYPKSERLEGREDESGDDEKKHQTAERAGSDACGMEHPQSHGRIERRPESIGGGPLSRCCAGGLGYSNDSTQERFGPDGGEMVSEQEADGHDAPNPWSRFDLIPCADGRARRIESGTFPLAHGIPSRVGRLRAYGNAINPWVAKIFIESVKEFILSQTQEPSL